MSKTLNASHLAFGLALLLVSPPTATAQERQGLWGSVAAGFLNLHLSVSDDSLLLLNSGIESGGVAEFAVGWGFDQRWLVGAEVSVVSGTLGRSIEWMLGQVSGIVLFYPAGNFFIKGGAGGAFVETELVEDIPPTLRAGSASGVGLGVTTGAGYDWYIGHGISVTPAVGFWYGQPGGVPLGNREIFSDWTQKGFQLTVGVRFN